MVTPALHIDVSQEGAVASFVDPGLTVRTANRVAIEAAAVSAQTLGVALYFPSVNGLFWTDRRVHIHGAIGLHIQSDGMGGIRYPSDDVSVGTEDITGIWHHFNCQNPCGFIVKLLYRLHHRAHEVRWRHEPRLD